MQRTYFPALLFLCLAACSPAAHAQVIVAPNSLATTEGDARANSAPFNNVSRYQQIFSASQFSVLTGPALITQIAFRPDSSQTSAFSHTFSSIEFDLSTTSVSVSALSSTFASNVGADNVVTYAGPLTFTTSNSLGSGTAKQFDLIVNLAKPFLYNPGAGNLLLDIRNADPSFTGYIDLASDNSPTPQTRLNFLDNSTTGTTGSVQNFGIVTQFTFQAVPEPGAMGLLVGLAATSAWAVRSRLRRK